MPPKTATVRKIAPPAVRFPAATAWLTDELIPTYVKRTYSPRESWKDKPFSKEDVRFFSKGVVELSESFTEERPSRIPAYFQHPKFRSAYLLYFLPLQMSKFITVFQLHEAAIQAALAHGRARGVLRLADLGAGPGTASLALLLQLLIPAIKADEIPKIELLWFDTNRAIMEDGLRLVGALTSQFPKLRGKVSVHPTVAPWWKAADLLTGPTAFLLIGHVLNEASKIPGPPREFEAEGLHPIWSKLSKLAQGAGILMMEPAARRTSQQLSRLRDRILTADAVARDATSIWGPCLHAGACPLADGRDWCHFSVPAQVPGQWFREFSKSLGSERQWLKFSYVWFASPDYPAPMPDPNWRRVISDPLSKSFKRAGERTSPSEVLVCEPERPNRISAPKTGPLWRGDLIRLETKLKRWAPRE